MPKKRNEFFAKWQRLYGELTKGIMPFLGFLGGFTFVFLFGDGCSFTALCAILRLRSTLPYRPKHLCERYIYEFEKHIISFLIFFSFPSFVLTLLFRVLNPPCFKPHFSPFWAFFCLFHPLFSLTLHFFVALWLFCLRALLSKPPLYKVENRLLVFFPHLSHILFGCLCFFYLPNLSQQLYIVHFTNLTILSP